LYIGDKDVVHLITPKEGDGRSLQKSSLIILSTAFTLPGILALLTVTAF
jgi:hypothetical protein